MAQTTSASGVVVPQPMPWHRRLAAFAAATLLRISFKTWRLRWHDETGSSEIKGPVIFCVWHNRLPAALASYNDFAQARWPGQGLAAMISASKDGSLVASVVERFGVQPVRGSTSRRGPQALLEATTWMERGYNLVIPPDGPRGPVYQIQKGIIHLAQLTGRPIIPISNFSRWKVRLKSWDRFQILLPFALCHCYHGAAIWVPREATEAESEQLRAQLEAAMRAITKD
ncbi:MAG TPA: lysophospholipid acyltransferase family protein [Verrucomicrobiae bacterium]|jgi:hypothetical protein